MINIFSYTDFRKYLTDFYEDRKKSDSRFSYRSLSEQSGINPGNFIKMLKGERNLTLVAAIKLSQPMGLNKRERDYFQAMIRFSQAKKHDEKKRCFEELITFKESSVRVLDAGYYMFYDKWYYTAVREALSFFPLNDNNFAELGKTIIPVISVKQIEKTVKLLLELKLIEKTESGLYQRTDAVLSTGNEMRSLILNNFVINTMKLAAQAINARVQETNLSTVTCSLSSEGFNQVQEEIRKCRRRILEIAKDNNIPDRVYQFNMQLFPLTERYDGRQS